MATDITKQLAKAIHGDKKPVYNTAEMAIDSQQLLDFAKKFIHTEKYTRPSASDAHIGRVKQRFVKALREYLVNLIEKYGFLPKVALQVPLDTAIKRLKSIRYDDVAHLHTGVLNKRVAPRVKKAPTPKEDQCKSAVVEGATEVKTDEAGPVHDEVYDNLMRDKVAASPRGFVSDLDADVSLDDHNCSTASEAALASILRTYGFAVDRNNRCLQLMSLEGWKNSVEVSWVCSNARLTHDDLLKVLTDFKTRPSRKRLVFKSVLWLIHSAILSAIKIKTAEIGNQALSVTFDAAINSPNGFVSRPNAQPSEFDKECDQLPEESIASYLRTLGIVTNASDCSGILIEEEEWNKSNAPNNTLLTYSELAEVIRQFKLDNVSHKLFFKTVMHLISERIQQMENHKLGLAEEKKQKAAAEQAAKKEDEANRLKRQEDLAHLALRAMGRSTLIVPSAYKLVDSMTIWDYMREPGAIRHTFLERTKKSMSRAALVAGEAAWRRADYLMFKKAFKHFYDEVLRGDYTHKHSLLMQHCANYYRTEFSVFVAQSNIVRRHDDPSADTPGWLTAIASMNAETDTDKTVAAMAGVCFAAAVSRQILLDMTALAVDVKHLLRAHTDAPYSALEIGEYRSRFNDLYDVLKQGRRSRCFVETHAKQANTTPFSLSTPGGPNGADLFDGEDGMAVALGQLDAFITTGRGDFDGLYRICSTTEYMYDMIRALLIGAVNESCKAKDHTERMEEIEAVISNVQHSICQETIFGPTKPAVDKDGQPANAFGWVGSYETSYSLHLSNPQKETYLPYNFRKLAKELLA